MADKRRMQTRGAPSRTGRRPPPSRWTKSSFSGYHNSCLRVIQIDPGRVAVGNSTDPMGPQLIIMAMYWEAFRGHLQREPNRSIGHTKFILDPLTEEAIELIMFVDRVEWHHLAPRRSASILTLTWPEHMAAVLGIVHQDEMRVTLESEDAIKHHVKYTQRWQHMAPMLPHVIGKATLVEAAS
jgi:hypothetical protein